MSLGFSTVPRIGPKLSTSGIFSSQNCGPGLRVLTFFTWSLNLGPLKKKTLGIRHVNNERTQSTLIDCKLLLGTGPEKAIK